nr:MAG: capsid protein [Cressdnaviricota sp.]
MHKCIRVIIGLMHYCVTMARASKSWVHKAARAAWGTYRGINVAKKVLKSTRKSIKSKKPTSKSTTKQAPKLNVSPKANGAAGYMKAEKYTAIAQNKNRTTEKVLKTLPRITELRQQAGRIVSTVGTQAVDFAHFPLYSVYDLVNLNGGTGDANQVGAKGCVNYLRKCRMRLLATNQGNSTMFVHVYTMRCRKQTIVSEYPGLSWSQGLTDLGGTTVNTTWNETPFISPRFTEFYKVLKITNYVLAPGETMDHYITVKANCQFNQEIVNEMGAVASNCGGVRGLTHNLGLITYSAPYNDSTTKTQVSLGASNLDWVTSTCYEFQLPPAGVVTNAAYSTISLPNAFTVNENVEDSASGAAATYTQA